MPDVSVIIPSYQRCKSLGRCLSSLVRQTLPAERYEVLVVIDGSLDGSREMVEAFCAPYALFGLWQPNSGRAVARNAGMHAARGGLLVFLDDDMEAEPNLLAAHQRAHAGRHKQAVIGPVPVSRPASVAGRYIAWKFGRQQANLARSGGKVGHRDFYSGNFSISRETMLEVVHGFDESFKQYGHEDGDLALRLLAAGGGLVYCPEARANQSYTKSFAGLAEDLVAKGHTSVQLARKHPDVVSDLKLSHYRDQSLKWRAPRLCFLALSSAVPQVSSLLAGAMEALYWLPSTWLYQCCDWATDSFYWLGVLAEMRSQRLGPRRVAYFTDSPGFGGAEEVLLSLLRELDRARWRPFLVYHPGLGIAPLVEEARRLDVGLRPVPRIEGKGAWLRFVQLARELRHLKPAVFHAQLISPQKGVYGLMAAALARIPAIVAMEQLSVVIRSPGIVATQRLLCQVVGRYIAASYELGRRLRGMFGFPAAKVVVVHNGIPLGRFEHLPTSPPCGTRLDQRPTPVVLTVARLDAQKGHRYLLEAASSVPGAIFALAGDGPERERLRAQADRLGLAGRVQFLGHRPDIPELLASCDLFVLPSLFEGLPLSVLEAMAAGKPVIATAVGGTAEAVAEGETGLLVPPGDPAALAAAIGRLLGDADLARRMGAAGRDRVRRGFTAQAMTRGVTNVYEDLLAGHE